MVVIRKLLKNGNGIQLGMPRAFLSALNWNGGDMLALELMEDQTVWIRRPSQRDLRVAVRIPMTSAPVKAGE